MAESLAVELPTRAPSARQAPLARTPEAVTLADALGAPLPSKLTRGLRLELCANGSSGVAGAQLVSKGDIADTDR